MTTHECPHCGRDLAVSDTPTRRELEVFRAYLAAGTAKGAAHDLGLSIQTVKNYMTTLYKRVGCDNASQVAYRLGQGEWTEAGT